MRVLNPLPTAVMALSVILTLLQGCGEVKVRSGTPVAPSLLESRLTVGQSTAEDIRQVLGEPPSVGRELLPIHSEPRTVWSYHFEEGQMSLGGSGDSRRIFVWVFLADERYDGYLWVSTFPADRMAP